MDEAIHHDRVTSVIPSQDDLSSPNLHPMMQPHLNEPSVFSHLWVQLSVSVSHSLISIYNI